MLRLQPGNAKADTKTGGVHAEPPARDPSRQARQGATARRALPSIPDTPADVPQQVSATQCSTSNRCIYICDLWACRRPSPPLLMSIQTVSAGSVLHPSVTQLGLSFHCCHCCAMYSNMALTQRCLQVLRWPPYHYITMLIECSLEQTATAAYRHSCIPPQLHTTTAVYRYSCMLPQLHTATAAA